jgi:hypothetical protein
MYEQIFREMYNALIKAGQVQREAYRIATEQATATVLIPRQKEPAS